MDSLTPPERLKAARQASTLSLVAAILCFLSSCGGSFFTLLFALPLSIWSLKLARDALSGDASDPVVEAYATPARNLSAAVLVFCSIFLLFVAIVLAFYSALIVAAIGGNL